MFLMAGLMLLNTAVFCVVAHFYTYQDPSQFEAAETPRDTKQDGNQNKGFSGDAVWIRGGQRDRVPGGLYDQLGKDLDGASRQGYDGDTESVVVMAEKERAPLTSSEY